MNLDDFSTKLQHDVKKNEIFSSVLIETTLLLNDESKHTES